MRACSQRTGFGNEVWYRVNAVYACMYYDAELMLLMLLRRRCERFMVVQSEVCDAPECDSLRGLGFSMTEAKARPRAKRRSNLGVNRVRRRKGLEDLAEILEVQAERLAAVL